MNSVSSRVRSFANHVTHHVGTAGEHRNPTLQQIGDPAEQTAKYARSIRHAVKQHDVRKLEQRLATTPPGADLAVALNTPLEHGSKRGDRLLHFLSDGTINPDQARRMTAMLVAKGANVSAQNVSGETPVMRAIINRQTAQFETMIQAPSFDLNARMPFPHSPGFNSWETAFNIADRAEHREAWVTLRARYPRTPDNRVELPAPIILGADMSRLDAHLQINRLIQHAAAEQAAVAPTVARAELPPPAYRPSRHASQDNPPTYEQVARAWGPASYL